MKTFGEIADEVGIFEGSIGYGKYVTSKERLGNFYAAIVVECNNELDRLNKANDMMRRMQKKLDELFHVAMVGSCTCLNKSPDEYCHQPTCRFKILNDIYKRPVTGE